jgi:hypothetical protein
VHHQARRVYLEDGSSTFLLNIYTMKMYQTAGRHVPEDNNVPTALKLISTNIEMLDVGIPIVPERLEVMLCFLPAGCYCRSAGG